MLNIFCHRHPCARTNRLADTRDFVSWPQFLPSICLWRSFKVKANWTIWLSELCRTFLVTDTHALGPTVWPTGRFYVSWPRFRTSNSPWMKFKVKGNALLWLRVLCRIFFLIGIMCQDQPLTNWIDFLFHDFDFDLDFTHSRTSEVKGHDLFWTPIYEFLY